MKKIYTLMISVLFLGCKTNIEESTVIEFGNLRNMKISEIISEIELIPLETTEESLIGYIDQIEFYEDKIYILDSHYSSSIFVFSKEGDFLSKLSKKGRGPGEYFYPISFTIDPRGGILILDWNLIKLFKYNITDLTFVEEVPLPVTPSPPMSFVIDDKDDLYYFYKPINMNTSGDHHHFVVSDHKGTILSENISRPYSGGFMYGGQVLFHKSGECIYGSPFFSNTIYEFNKDVIKLKYQLKFGDYSFPDEDFFKQIKNSGGNYLKELNDNPKLIKYMLVSQSDKFLVASYQSVNDYYLGVFDKNRNKSINVKIADLIDDHGLGFILPHPIIHYNDYFIGWLNGTDISINQIQYAKPIAKMRDIDENSNPVLVLYKLRELN